MAKHVWMVACLVVSGAALAGCGGDDDGGGAKDSGAPEGGTDGGAGGMSGGGGGGAGGAGGSGMTAQPVECGSNTCQPPSNPLAGLIGMFAGALGGGMALPTPQACCLDEGAGTCGISMTVGGTCEELAVTDARCPRLMFPMLGPIDIGSLLGPDAGAGCCTDDNQCGLNGTLFGRGCVELSEAATMLGGLGGGGDGGTGLGGLGGGLMFPEPRACDAPPDDDAGMSGDDAGL